MSAVTHNVFSAIKLTLLLGFAACALPALLAHGIPASPWPPAGHWGPALLLMLFALGGLESTVVSNGEMLAPARDLPFALVVGMGCIVAIYGAVLLGAMATVPDLGHATRPVFDGAVWVLGPWGGVAVVAGGVTSMAGVMFVILFGGPRALFAMAEGGQMPAWCAALHPRWRTPHRAVLAHAVVAWALALGAGFLGALSAATLTRLLFYAAVAAASVRLQRTGFSETARPLVLPGATLMAGVVLVLSALVVSQSTWVEVASVGGVLALGGVALLAVPSLRAGADKV
jgi:amino acid transporter